MARAAAHASSRQTRCDEITYGGSTTDNAGLVLVEAVIADRVSDQPASILMDLHMLVLGLGK